MLNSRKTRKSPSKIPEARLDYGDIILSYDDTPLGLSQLWQYRANLLETTPQALIDYLFYKQEILDEKKERVLQKLALLKNIAPSEPEIKPVILLSDIDNTFVAHKLKRSRHRLDYYLEECYPGINQLYQALLDGPADANSSMPARCNGKLGFLTARPGNPISRYTPGLLSEATQKLTSDELASTGIEKKNQLILWGTATDFIPTFGQSSFFQGIHNGKVANFEIMARIYTGYNFIFFGDNGEADLEVAQALYAKYQSENFLSALFIHDVKDLELSDTQKEEYESKNIFIYNSIIKAAAIAAENSLISVDQALKIAKFSINDTKCRFELDPDCVHNFNLRIQEILEDLQYMSKALLPLAQSAEYRAELKNLANNAFVNRMITPKKRKLNRAAESSSELGITYQEQARI